MLGAMELISMPTGIPSTLYIKDTKWGYFYLFGGGGVMIWDMAGKGRKGVIIICSEPFVKGKSIPFKSDCLLFIGSCLHQQKCIWLFCGLVFSSFPKYENSGTCSSLSAIRPNLGCKSSCQAPE